MHLWHEHGLNDILAVCKVEMESLESGQGDIGDGDNFDRGDNESD